MANRQISSVAAHFKLGYGRAFFVRAYILQTQEMLLGARADPGKLEPEDAAGCVCEQGPAGTAGDVPVQAQRMPPPPGVTKSLPVDYSLGSMRRR